MPGFEAAPYPIALRDLDTQKRAEAWAHKALDGECARVSGAANGTRNADLNRAAYSLGQLVGGGYLDEHTVRSRLEAAATDCGLQVDEGGPAGVRATIDSGLTAGMAEPRHPSERPRLDGRGQHTQNCAPTPRSSRFYCASSLQGKPVPPREWLVHGLVPQKTVTLFSGDGGTGKSLLALQLAVAVAADTSWIGKATQSGTVIYLSAEDDDDELHRRLDAILTAQGRSYDSLSGLTLRSLAGEDALLAVDSQIALMQSELFKELDARAGEENPSLIVIDTLADVYPANENDRAKVRQFVGILRGLALKRSCAVMLLAHPSLTGLNSGTGTSGSTAWNNSVRSRLYLSRIVDDGYEPDPDARVLTTMKANYGRVGGEINLKWDAGVFVAEVQPTGLDSMAASAKAERVFMKLLAEAEAQGRRVNHAGGNSYAPNVFASNTQGNEGVTKRAFKGAMEKLLMSRAIKISEDGPPSKRRQYLEVAE